MKRNCKSNRNGSDGGLLERSTRKLTKWVTKNIMISAVEYLTTVTMNHNKKQYKWCNYCNNLNFVWVYHWKVGHREWK